MYSVQYVLLCDLIEAVTCVAGAEAIEWISKAFTDESALLKHELAYCLGQMQDTRAIHTLTAVLKDTQQESMVRHEAGEHTHMHTFWRQKDLEPVNDCELWLFTNECT